jgi:hypothetical protein
MLVGNASSEDGLRRKRKSHRLQGGSRLLYCFCIYILARTTACADIAFSMDVATSSMQQKTGRVSRSRFHL